MGLFYRKQAQNEAFGILESETIPRMEEAPNSASVFRLFFEKYTENMQCSEALRSPRPNIQVLGGEISTEL